MRRFSLLLLISGLGALIAAVLWWFLFWRAVVKRLGGSISDALPCLAIENSTYCSAINLVSDISGRTPYEPALLWAGFLALMLAGIIRLGAR